MPDPTSTPINEKPFYKLEKVFIGTALADEAVVKKNEWLLDGIYDPCSTVSVDAENNIYWESGKWLRGTFRGKEWRGGQFNGAFAGDHWLVGTFIGGTFAQGSIWHNGHFMSGHFRGDEFRAGQFDGGEFKRGVFGDNAIWTSGFYQSVHPPCPDRVIADVWRMWADLGEDGIPIVHIGCLDNTFADWDEFFSPECTKDFETARHTKKFAMIKAQYEAFKLRYNQLNKPKS